MPLPWIKRLQIAPELAKAQFEALQRDAIVIYLSLFVVAGTLTYIHWDNGPRWINILFAAGLGLFAVVRLVNWRGFTAPHRLAGAIQRVVFTSTAIAGLMGTAFLAWTVLLSHHPDPETRMFTLFTLWICLIWVSVVALRVRAAVLLISCGFVPPYLLVLLLRPEPIYHTLAAMIGVMTLLLTRLLTTICSEFTNLVASRHDLRLQAERLQALSEENECLANLDMLTGLANRRRFLTELELTLTEASAARTGFAVGMMDLEGFKPVNDAFGYSVGDRVLIEVGHRLQDVLGETAFVARVGGDEFAMIIKGSHSDGALAKIGDKLCAAISNPYEVPGRTARINCFIGLVSFPESGRRAATLFERADYALCHAKRSRQNRTVVFSEQHEARLLEMARIEQALRTADLENEMYLAFQPIFDIETRRTCTFEALARWTNGELGAIGPNKFIPVAERTELIGGITEILLRKAARAAARWPEHVGLSFNLSACDLADPGLADRVAAILASARLNPERVDFEITETAALRDPTVVRANLDAIAALGCGIALDDFGSGQSNLAYIHQLPLTKIKIDASFVATLRANPVGHDVIRTIVELSRSLGCSCIIEGVETAEQMVVLKMLGCRLIQGYYYGKPMSATEALARIVGEQALERRASPQLAVAGAGLRAPV